MLSAWNFFAPAKTAVLLKSTVFATQAGACDGGVAPATCASGGCTIQHNAFQSQQSVWTHLEGGHRNRPALQRAACFEDRSTYAASLLNKLAKGLQKTLFPDRVNSEMSYILILPQHDSRSWTDLTFLLKPAIRPGHFLPPRLYFQ